jgi:hypothetical protein
MVYNQQREIARKYELHGAYMILLKFAKKNVMLEVPCALQAPLETTRKMGA